jgi:hypothetical protein
MGQQMERANEPAVAAIFREPDANPRHEVIRKDIAQRLRKSCSHLSDEEFVALVEKLLKVQLKGERRFNAHYVSATYTADAMTSSPPMIA